MTVRDIGQETEKVIVTVHEGVQNGGHMASKIVEAGIDKKTPFDITEAEGNVDTLLTNVNLRTEVRAIRAPLHNVCFKNAGFQNLTTT